MSDALPEPPQLDPSELSQTQFTKSRKGLEPTQVRNVLNRAEDALRAWAKRDAASAAEIERLGGELAEAENLDESRAAELLGSQTAKVVSAAREAASEIREQAQNEADEKMATAGSKAQEAADALVASAEQAHEIASSAKDSALSESAELLAEAKSTANAELAEARKRASEIAENSEAEATRIAESAAEEADRLKADAQTRHEELVAAASTVFDEKTAEASEAANEIQRTAERAAALMREEAEGALSDAQKDADAELDRARREGREMLAEAKVVRQRMLQDLAGRRRGARQQIEAAKAAKQVIVESMKTLTVRLDDSLAEIHGADDVVQSAADSASTNVVDDVEITARRIEADLDSGTAGDEIEFHDSRADAPSVPLRSSTRSTRVKTPPTAPVKERIEAKSADIDSGDKAKKVEDPSDGVPSSADSDGDSSIDGHILKLADEDLDAETAEGDADDDASIASVHDLFEKLRAGDDDEGSVEEDLAELDAELDAADDSDEKAPDAVDGEGKLGTNSSNSSSSSSLIDITQIDDDDPTDSPDADGARTPSVEVGESGGGASTADDAGPGDGGGTTTLTQLAVAADTDVLERRDELLAPAEKLMARSLKRLISDEQNDVLDRARRAKKGRIEIDQLLVEADPESISGAVSDAFLLSAVAGAQMWCELTGAKQPDISRDKLSDALTAKAASLFELRQIQLRGVLTDIEESGEDSASLVDRLRAAYREIRSTSLPEFAADLAISGFTEGTILAAANDSSWRWIPDNGGVPCSDAEDNSLAGSVACGAEFPTGDSQPPAHAGCRCILAPEEG